MNNYTIFFGLDQISVINEVLDKLIIEGSVVKYTTVAADEMMKYEIEFDPKNPLGAAYKFGHAQAMKAHEMYLKYTRK